MEIKFKLDTTLRELKLLVIKTGTNFWIDYIYQNSTHNKDLHYILKNIHFKTMKSKMDLDFDIESFTSKNSQLEKCIK